MKRANLLGPRDMRHQRARGILDSLGREGERCELLVYAGMEPEAAAITWRNTSYVACTTGLLSLLTRGETHGVFAHEVVHILKGHTLTPLWYRLIDHVGVSDSKVVAAVMAFQSRRYELISDADITSLGADPAELHSALRKMGNNARGLNLWQYLTTGTHPRHGKRLGLLEQQAMRTVKARSGRVTPRPSRGGPSQPRRLSPTAVTGSVLGR